MLWLAAGASCQSTSTCVRPRGMGLDDCNALHPQRASSVLRSSACGASITKERARGQRAAPDEAVETLHRSDGALAAARRPPAAGAPLAAGLNIWFPHRYTSMFDRAFLAQLAHVKVVMPTPAADRDHVSDPQLWFDLDEGTWKAKYLNGDYSAASELLEDDIQLMQQIEESANYVGAVVEREISLAGNASKVAIAGFSHGGVVAVYTALTKLSQPLGCCVAVGGPPVLPQLLGRKIKPHLRDTPVHCLGGAADATFPASDCKHVVDSVLSAALPAANFKEIPYGQHEVGGLEIGALADVFADNVKL